MKLTDDERAEAIITIRRGLGEDLRYGPDITTIATVPETLSTTSVWCPAVLWCGAWPKASVARPTRWCLK